MRKDVTEKFSSLFNINCCKNLERIKPRLYQKTNCSSILTLYAQARFKSCIGKNLELFQL